MAKKKDTQTPIQEKIEPIEFLNNEELTSAIKKISDLQKERDTISSEINAKIQELQEELTNKVAPIEKEIKLLGYSMRVYCDKRKDLFFKEKKTWSLATGDLQYRKSPDAVESNSTKKLVDSILKKNNMLEASEKFSKKLAKIYLTMDIKLDKQAIQKDPKKAKEVTGVGLVEGQERFHIKPYETNLEIEAPLEA
ncbi:MAG: host-nuclease inhibitor Gam family protein [Leptospiraceae bacterium]|nr:host-nuclease inhibitor Gam family protein [Leptospiraceae bacterium]